MRNIVFRLPENLPPEEINKLFQKGIFLLRLSSEILDFFENLENEDKVLLRNLASAVFEAIFITQTLLDYVGKKTPLFFEEITVFSEPVLEKLEQVVKTFHSLLNEEEKNVDFEEMAYILDELAKTLDVAFSVAQKTYLRVL